MSDRESGALAAYPSVLVGAEVAKILRLDPRNVAAAANSGALPGFRAKSPNAEWRFDKRRIIATIEGSSAELPPLLADYPEVLKAAEVARLLRYDPRTVPQMAASGALPGAFKVGGERAHWRFWTRALSEMIEAPVRAAEDTPPPG